MGALHDLSPAEREAWRTIESMTEALARRDWEAFFSHFHPDFVGWTLVRATPVTLDSRRKWVPFMYASVQIIEYEVQPLSVRVYGDTAVCHYLAFKAKKRPDGGLSLEKEKWSDVLKKEDGRWVLISDSGGPAE